MLFYYHCHIVNGVEDIKDFFICIIIIDGVYVSYILKSELNRIGTLPANISAIQLQI